MTPHHHIPDVPDGVTPIYAAAFGAYRDAGWTSPLPLPPGRKKHPPEGYTGNHGKTPSYADCWTWAEERPDSNIALRLPATVIGIDVDDYGTKTGGATLTEHETRLGPLPPTWRTTSRDDGISGIRLYRAPAGLAWPSVLGDSIEIIRHAHRYAIVWPSIHPDTSNTYRWINPDGLDIIGEVPGPDDFPLLPPTWVDGLTGGEEATDRPRANLTDPQAKQWLGDRPTGTPCPAVQRVLQKRSLELTTPGGHARHDVMLEATQRLAYLAAEGHPGVTSALDTLQTVFLAVVTRDHTRSQLEAENEWDRALAGAIRNAAALPAQDDGDPCVTPYASLARQAPPSPSELIHQATRKEHDQWQPSSTSSATTSSPTSDAADTATPGASDTNTPSAPDAENSDADEPLPPSWRPIDLTPYLNGTWTPDQPTMLVRVDGQALLYPGKVHDLHGESESGKSLVAQIEATNRLNTGDNVLYIDFEDDAGPITSRLLNLGAAPETIRNHFTYVRPEQSPYAFTETAAWADLLNRSFSLVILDGVTDALGQYGAATKDNDDIASWHRNVARMLARRTNGAVVLVDHVSKNGDTRGRFAIGGQAKMAAIDGASYSVEVTNPIGKGLDGTITLRVGKDRPGEIRAHCGAWRAADRTQEAARIHIDSTAGDGTMHVEILPPESSVHDANDNGQAFKPTGVMEKLSHLLESRREEISLRGLLAAFKDDGGRARQQIVYDAINLLVEGGFAIETEGPRRARMFRSAAVYRQKSDPEADAYEPPIDLPDTTVSHRVPTVSGHGAATVSRVRVPRRGHGHSQRATETVTVSGPQSPPEPNTRTQHDEAPDPLHWRLDYQLGEWVHKTTGELWHNGDNQ